MEEEKRTDKVLATIKAGILLLGSVGTGMICKNAISIVSPVGKNALSKAAIMIGGLAIGDYVSANVITNLGKEIDEGFTIGKMLVDEFMTTVDNPKEEETES